MPFPAKLSTIFYPWHHQQLSPPVWGFAFLGLPWYPLAKLQDRAGSWRHVLLPSSLEVSSDPLRKDATTGSSSSGSSRSEPLLVAPSSPDPIFGPVEVSWG